MGHDQPEQNGRSSLPPAWDRVSRRRILIFLVVTIVVVAATGFASQYGRAYWIKTHGMTVVPSHAQSVADIPFYLQNDPRWGAESMGTSAYRLGGSGCLVACLAAASASFGVETDPGRLNQAFSARGVYTSTGDVIWTKIAEAVPGVTYEYERVFDAGTLEADLRAGRLPLVKVKYHGSGAPHWLLIIGAGKEDFLVMDPLNEVSGATRLSLHGKVFAYRVLVTADDK